MVFNCVLVFPFSYFLQCKKPVLQTLSTHPLTTSQLFDKIFVKSWLRVPHIYLEFCCYFAVQRFCLFFFLANPERIIQLIRRDYKSAVLCPFPWCEDELQFKLDNIFTRLKIVSKTMERSKLTHDDVVNMTDIFRPHVDCENPRVVLVEGNPAMGKTTFCQKLAHDWSLSRIPADSWFPEVEMVLLLKCRDVNVGITDIEQAIDDQLLPIDVDRNEKEKFFDYIHANQSRILLVLDGLDEMRHEELFQGLLSLIQGKVLSNIYLLFTARLEMGAKVRRYCDSLLQIVGYSKDDAISYIEQYFRNHSDPGLAQKLKEKLAHDFQLQELTTSPMNTALLCLLCEETNGIFPTNQTELYECLVSCAIRRYFAKRGVDLGQDDPSESCIDQLNQLGKMAFEALLKNRLYFSREEIKSEDFLQLCFVTREPSKSKLKPTPCYAFTHKTFQEYFAALYLANLVLADSKEGGELLLKVSPMDNWQVWKFLFPLVAKKDGERALFLVSCLGRVSSRLAIPEPPDDITETTPFDRPGNFFLDVFPLVSAFHRPDVDIVGKVVAVIAELEGFHWVRNDFQRKMAVKLAECIPLDECELFTSAPYELLTFSEYLRSSCTLRKLFMHFDAHFFSSREIKALAQALCTNCVLTHLDLDTTFDVGSEIAVALSEALESNTTLTHLRFTDTGETLTGPSGASALARALTKNSTLKCLILKSNNIMDSGAQAFADALRRNSTLSQLDLSSNHMGHSGTEAICNALQSNQVMTHLDLGSNTIDDSGAEALAGALQSPATQLSHLKLSIWNITSVGVESLAEALQTNRSLTYLYLQNSSSFSRSATAKVYECLVSCAIRRYFAKRGVDLGEDVPSERCRDQLNQLAKMAFELLLKNRLYFSRKEVNSEDFLQLFFVTREPSKSRLTPTPCYAFTDKTFQQYFAALYLANRVLADSKEGWQLLLKVSPTDNWHVWKFLFPLVAKKDGERAMFLVSCLGRVSSRLAIPEPPDDITEITPFDRSGNFFLDVFPLVRAFHRPDVDIVGNAVAVIAELEDFDWVLNDLQRKMAGKLAECIPLDECELFTSAPYELLTFSEYLRGSCSLRKLFLHFDAHFFSSCEIKALAQALCTNCVLTHLDLETTFDVGDEIAVAVSEALESNTTLTHLRFTDTGETLTGPSGASALARALTKNSTLKCLILKSNNIMDSGAQAFADALRRNSTLSHLDLSSNCIGYLGTEAICKALQSNQVMTHLDLGSNTIDDSGAEALAGALQSPATQLSHLKLSIWNITYLGVESLAGAFQTNRSLKYLNLDTSSISCSATALAEALELNRTLTHLILRGSDIGDFGTEVICKALQSNRVMTYLNLSDSTIGDSGAEALAGALQSPATQLSYLRLDSCHITFLGVEFLAGALQTNRSLTYLSLIKSIISCSVTALSEALQVNRSLTHLDLSWNQISDTEAIQLAQTLLDKNNTLAYLDLRHNNIGAEGKAKLELVNQKRCVIEVEPQNEIYP